MATIADIRKEYKLQTLSETDIGKDPFAQFGKWWQEALNAGIEEANAMTLATATADGMPDARIVLLKGFDERGFTFYTNYNSTKACSCWKIPAPPSYFSGRNSNGRFVSAGLVNLAPARISDEYFDSRPEGSRIGAWASPQSEPITGREWLEENEKRYRELWQGKTIVRPPHWGGYVLKPVRIEFWQGRPSRLHDRFLFTLQSNGLWKIERLAP